MQSDKEIFQRGSTTYYWSSAFFPATVRDDVFKLYSFVRVVDNFVDETPQDISALAWVEKNWGTDAPVETTDTPGRVLTNMRELVAKYDMPREWVDAFLQSMRWDADTHAYPSIEDSLEYVYGSAEVIGLMMSRILGLSEKAEHGAQLQGRAMQWINFCRDIAEDLTLDRCYFPQPDLAKHGLADLREDTARANADAFRAFMREQLERYRQWQHEADAAYTYIPKRLRIPVRTASNMYLWTADRIAEDPFVVYDRKVKPSKYRIIYEVARNSLHA